MKIRFLSGILLSALSGILILLSFPPYGIWPLAWIGLIPCLIAQYRFFPVKWSSLAPALAILFWLGPFLARLFGSEFGPVFEYLGVWIALLIFFLQKERKFIESTEYRWFILQGVTGWVGFEMVRVSFIPLVATSGFIGYTQSTQPWVIQPVSIFGIFGLDLVILLVNFSLAQGLLVWFDRQWKPAHAVSVNGIAARRWGIITGFILVAWIGLSVIILLSFPKDTPKVRVATVRPGFALPAHRDSVSNSQVRFDKFAIQIREAASKGAQIIYSPEMLFNFNPQAEYTEQFRMLARETGAYLFITYTVSAEGEPWRNESVMLSPAGNFSAVYGKNHTWGIGEPTTPTAGNFVVYDTPLGKLAGLICHDANYTDIARKLSYRGARIIAAPYCEFGGFGEQAWNNVLFRAVENRTAFILSGTNTVSAIINPDGTVVALNTDIKGSDTILVGNINAGPDHAPYTKLGDIMGWVSLAGMIFFIVFQIIEQHNKHPSRV